MILFNPVDHVIGIVGIFGRSGVSEPMYRQIAEGLRQKIDPFVTALDVASGFGGEGGTAAYANDVASWRRKPEISTPRIEIHQAASELQLAEGSAVVSRHQQRYIDDTPWSLQTTFYPMTFVEQGAQFVSSRLKTWPVASLPT
jgi:hypothetical protein